jgi:hypothetical protein
LKVATSRPHVGWMRKYFRYAWQYTTFLSWIVGSVSRRYYTDSHKSDYDVFLSPLEDFKTEMTKAGFDDKVVYLDRGDRFDFEVREPNKST